MRRVALLLVGCLLAAGCIDLAFPQESSALVSFPPPPPAARAQPAAQANDTGDLVLVWDDAPSHAATRDALEKDGNVAGWIAALNNLLALPRDVPIRHTECGQENAFYNPETGEVMLCYELLDRIAYTMSNAQIASDEVPRATGDAWLFVAFHEIGHALIDAYSLPVTGREEDAADDLATLLLVHAGASDAALDAAMFWALTQTGEHSAAEFADEHSLNEQRFYAILCTVYGSDPQKDAWLVSEGYLPEERAPRCVVEYHKKDASWSTLLAPWAKPGVRAA